MRLYPLAFFIKGLSIMGGFMQKLACNPASLKTMTRCKKNPNNNKLYHSTMADNSLWRSLAAHVPSCNQRSKHNVWIKVLSRRQEYKTTGLDGTGEQQATSYPS